MDSVAVILNPAAGPARSRLAPASAAALLRAAGFSAEVLTMSGPRHGVELAARAAERHGVVAALGGDGTVGEVAEGLSGTGAALALLPVGSGNDFAWGLGVSDLAAGIATLRSGTVLAVDACRFAGRFFVNSCGLFFDGQVSLRAAGISRRFGRWRYPLATLSLLPTFRPARAGWLLETVSGTESLEGGWMLAEIGNGPRCGGGFLLTPHADPTDGLLDFCLVEAIPRWTFLRTLPRGIDGSHLGSPHVISRRVVAATLRAEEPLPVHWDGEADRLPPGEYRFEVEPGRVRVLAPGGRTA
jgi:diacylglycerol kinase (ATP)